MDSSERVVKYDEFLEGGIPDALLAGLGFPKSTKSDVDPNRFKNTSSDEENDALMTDTRRANDRSISAPSEKPFLPSSGVVRYAKTPTDPLPVPPVNARSGRKREKFIIKGNIMYERTETGEVIASLLKNTQNVSNVEPPVVAQTLPSQSKSRKSSSSYSSDVVALPSNCPLNEDNVEDVLERSIEATDDMRRMLTALKDDLRRMGGGGGVGGGGSNVAKTLTPILMKRRSEVAEKLSLVYADYQESIDDIYHVATEDDRLSGNTCAAFDGVGSGDVAEKIGGSRPGRGVRRKKKKKADGKQKADAVDLKGSSGNALGDLWMSCEPGSDDESEYVRKGRRSMGRSGSEKKSGVPK